MSSLHNGTVLFLKILLSFLHREPACFTEVSLSQEDVVSVLEIAREQAVDGMVIQGLIFSSAKMERSDIRQIFTSRQIIWQRNNELDLVVASFSRQMQEAGLRIWVVKGQTLARLYPVPQVRSSGDIDFFCHPDDWERTVAFIRDVLKVELIDTNSPKHIEYKIDGNHYEMHRTLVMLSHPRHQHYWDTIVQKEILSSNETVDIQGTPIPVLPPTINALFVFTHIFGHFISEGIGLRQFCDWAMVLKHYKDEIDVNRLSEHLEGIGLKKAFIGFGAILTDYLGMPSEYFPFDIPEKFHHRAPALWKNILKKGNFGKNKKYLKKSGPIHGLQHLWRIAGQAIRFGNYAPSESWWKIPRMFRWWYQKLVSKKY